MRQVEEGLAQIDERKRDFSLRRPTHSSRKTTRDAKNAQERIRKKKSACSVRNDVWRGRTKRSWRSRSDRFTS